MKRSYNSKARKDRAAERKIDLEPETQLIALNARLGDGVGAVKERAKIAAKIAAREAAKNAPKVESKPKGDIETSTKTRPTKHNKPPEKLKASQR